MTDINPCNIEALENLMDEATKPVIVTHMKPDGDAMGSSIAMYHYLLARCKPARIVLCNRQPSYLDFLTADIDSGNIVIYEENPQEAEAAICASDLIICLDFNAFHRADKLDGALSASKASKVLIDHHLNPDREMFTLSFSETEVSSASELLYHILMEMSDIRKEAGRLPAKAAEALMTGMTTDTNNFANSVYPPTLHMASDLLAAGTDRDSILQHLYNEFSENRLRIMGHMMKDLMTITDDGVAYIVLDSKTQDEYGVSEGDTEGFVNMPLSIASVRMSILMKEDGNRIRVSIRTKKGTSANTCARLHFNGGGHENAAGGRLNIPQDISGIDQAAAYIERHTHAYFSENEKDI